MDCFIPIIKGMTNCWGRTRSLINPSGGSSGGGVISLGRSGDSNKVVLKPLLIKHVPWVTQIGLLYHLPEPRSATMSFLPSPSTLEKGCLWTGGTGRHCETFCEVLIYFNRGWVPQSLGNASTRQEGQVGSDWSFFTFYIKISGDWWAGNIRSTPYNWANLQPDSEK